nr:ATP synthase F0 subunit 8 [Chelopistes texanus]
MKFWGKIWIFGEKKVILDQKIDHFGKMMVSGEKWL